MGPVSFLRGIVLMLIAQHISVKTKRIKRRKSYENFKNDNLGDGSVVCIQFRCTGRNNGFCNVREVYSNVN
jgi:hypothetical protein